MKKAIIAIVLVVVLVTILNSIYNNQVVNVEEDVNTETTETNQERYSGQRESSAGLYTEYSNNLEEYEGNDIVLFFKADWCPSCRALDSNIENNLENIPEDVVILELDYDRETELKRKYGVTTQHTLVQVDTEGNLIDKWSGGNRLVDVLNKIN